MDADALNRISESKLGSNFFLERKFKTWITPHSKEFQRLVPHIKSDTNLGLAFDAAKEFKISILFKGANSIVADNKKVWQLFGTDSQTCLLYTSDAADETTGVYLGGRRIIKKNFF